jgi:hypothetical protein
LKTISRETWADFPDVYVKLQKDELGYPPRQWEQLKGEPTGIAEGFRIKSIPHYARGLALGDEVLTGTSPEGYSPVVQRVTKRSGYSTMRLMIKPSEDKEALISDFTKRGVLLEFAGQLVALAIPRDQFEEVSNYVCDEKDRGRWDAEDGYLVMDEDDASTF